ncbi:pheromone processing endoprotease [Dissophora globulifera]|nr:pheromone processing endoprotease [Dissophora globulifera]
MSIANSSTRKKHGAGAFLLLTSILSLLAASHDTDSTASNGHAFQQKVQQRHRHNYHSDPPRYDHDQRDYYLIRVQPPYQPEAYDRVAVPWTLHSIDEQQIMGELLGLRFEARVGMLQDYFLYSSEKPVQNTTEPQQHEKSRAEDQQGQRQRVHFKRSLVATDEPWASVVDDDDIFEARNDVETENSIEVAHRDPVVQRFYQLKARYDSSTNTNNDSNGSTQGPRRWQKRHNNMHDDIVRAMGEIHKQELRQRVKKRAPLLDQDPTLASQSVVQRGPADPDDGETVDSEDSNGNNESDTDEQVSEDQGVLQDDDGEEDKEGEQEEQEEEEEEEEEFEEEDQGDGDDEDGEFQPEGEDQPEDDVASTFGFEDPGFRYQWHLHNTKEQHDINVTGVWDQGINGTGVNVAIIDDGLDMDSEDLAPNFFKEGSWDFNDHTALPKPRLIDDQHGTRCAGEIAAAKNDLCGVGVAFGAKVAGIRILSGQITDVDEAAALNYHFQENHIYSCSWGPPDDGRSMDAPKGVVLDAMVNGIKNGRSGLGSIYVFATGNGGSLDDDCNFDGYTNSLYTVSIGAIDRAQRHPYYSEACSAQLAVTYSNGGGSAIYTCDVGERRCFGHHGGTSAAAPIAAGMIALVLSIRPDLSWRDVQYLLMTTATPVSLNDADWKRTASGRLFNHKFGYGNLDAYKLVEAAKLFQSLGPQTSFHPPATQVGRPIPQGGKGVSSSLTVSKEDVGAEDVRLGRLEHVTVTVNIEHQRRGDVEVMLISPNGVESKLGARRRFDTATSGFTNWTFMTVKHWDEDVVGEWTLAVRDQRNPSYRGKFIDWRIQFWGELQKDLTQSSSKEEPTADKEKVLTESPGALEETHDTDSINDGSSDIGGTNEMDEVVDIDSKVIVNNDPTVAPELEKEKEQETDHAIGDSHLSQDPHVDNSSIASHSAENTNGSTTANSGDDAIKQDAAADAIAMSVAEAAEEAQISEAVRHTLYIFCGVLGLVGLIIGVLSRRKRDGRGQYVGVRGNSNAPLGLGQNFDNDDGDIDLLPRNIDSSRVGEHSDGYHVDGGTLSAELAPQSRPQKRRDGFLDGIEGSVDETFEIGSDTDDEDFLRDAYSKSDKGRSKSEL